MMLFVAGFIVGGLVIGFLVPLLFMWRADDAPRVRAVDVITPENGEGSSGGVVADE